MAFTEDQLRKELSELDITSRVKKIGEFSNAFGGYSDVWKCNYGPDLVAVKVIRLNDRDKARSLKKIGQEIQNWWRLHDHPNVLSLLGVCFWGPLPSPVSAWMQNGTVDVYVNANPEIDICFALCGIAEGLRYLHEQNIVHGDVKAVLTSGCQGLSGPIRTLQTVRSQLCPPETKSDFLYRRRWSHLGAATVRKFFSSILEVLRGSGISRKTDVSDGGNPQLADFGLSRNLIAMIDESTAVNITGSWRWMAVEFFGFDARRQFAPRQRKPSKSSDVWSFGMTVLELWSGSPPFVDIVGEGDILMALCDKKRPPFPEPPRRATLRFRDHAWLHNLCDRCWALEPTERPTMEEIAAELRHRVEPVTQTQNRQNNTLESCNSSESSDHSGEARTPTSAQSNLSMAIPDAQGENSAQNESQFVNISSPVDVNNDRIPPSPTSSEHSVTSMMADIDILGDEPFKSRLDTYAKRHRLVNCFTWKTMRSGPDHVPRWDVHCLFNGDIYGSGSALTKQQAAEAAAKEAY
ncbi:kinase-like protein, partial [Rickenella mellea]